MAVPDPRPVSPAAPLREPAPLDAPPPVAGHALVDPPPVGVPLPGDPLPVAPSLVPRAEPFEEPMRPLDTQLRLPAHRNKVERVADHTTGVVDDVKEWVELRIKLVRAELEMLIDTRVLALRGTIMFYGAAALAGLYFLVTLAVIIGAIFGGRYWIGFLVVNLILAGGAWWAKREFAPGAMHVERSKATGQIKVSHEDTPAQKEAKDKGEPEPEPGELNESSKPNAEA